MTLTWHILRVVNHPLRVLGPLMNRLTSTGVFFTSPSPVTILPACDNLGQDAQDAQDA
jgi:hypothetical protein